MRLILIPLLLLAAGVAADAADNAVTKAIKAMQSDDSDAKKAAINVLASSGDEAVVMPVLISAVGDRQVGRFAVEALRQRTGLRPAAARSANVGYPGYPSEDSVAAWKTWFQAKQDEARRQKELDEAMKAATDAQKQAQAPQGESSGGETAAGDAGADPATGADGQAAASQGGAAAQPENDYGRLDRIFLKDGGLVVAYIVSKRVDMDNNLTSVRIMHRGGAGEETLDASLIARIEEDIR